jgi:hypothetical protein
MSRDLQMFADMTHIPVETLLKMPRDLQMLFAAVTHLAEDELLRYD